MRTSENQPILFHKILVVDLMLNSPNHTAQVGPRTTHLLFQLLCWLLLKNMSMIRSEYICPFILYVFLIVYNEMPLSQSKVQ